MSEGQQHCCLMRHALICFAHLLFDAYDTNSCSIGVLKDAEYIYANAIDVLIDMNGTKTAASALYSSMQERQYSTEVWSTHDLHPNQQDFAVNDIVNFVFVSLLSSGPHVEDTVISHRWTDSTTLQTMDLLNFSYVPGTHAR